jgi:hypothetical protein
MDNRLYARVPVQPQCRAEFQLAHQSFSNLPVVNLGVEGCCLQVPAGLAQHLRNNLSVDGLELIHPSLPRTPLKGRLAWIERSGDPDTGLTAAGLRFMAAPGGFTSRVAAFVREWGEYDRRASGLDGMPA